MMSKFHPVTLPTPVLALLNRVPTVCPLHCPVTQQGARVRLPGRHPKEPEDIIHLTQMKPLCARQASLETEGHVPRRFHK